VVTGLQPAADARERVWSPVPHGDDVGAAKEDHDLADLQLGAHFERLQDQEEGIAIDVELRPLVGFECVLDREWVQVELACHSLELTRAGLVQCNPDELIRMLAGMVDHIFELRRLDLFALAVPVDGTVHDHETIVAHASCRRARGWTVGTHAVRRRRRYARPLHRLVRCPR
jgi:hypothetical protein